MGKSTLLNRILGRREPPSSRSSPGVTRDRKDVEADWQGRRFRLVDTGGWLARGDRPRRQGEPPSPSGPSPTPTSCCSWSTSSPGATEDDARVADLLRGLGKPVLLVANKVDDAGREHQIWELMALGLGEPRPGQRPPRPGHRRPARRRGRTAARRRPRTRRPATRRRPRRRGRGRRRRVVRGRHRRAPQRGQVDAVQPADRRRAGRGPRHAGHHPRHDRHGRRDRPRAAAASSTRPACGASRRIDEGTEYYSLVRALQAVDEADVALLVIDATEGVTDQDQRLAERIDAAGCPVVIVLNKWELLDADGRADVRWQVADKLRFLGDVAGAEDQRAVGQGRAQAVPGARPSVDAYRRRVPTARGQRGDPRAQPAQPAPGRGPGALRHPGRDRPADVHAVRQPGAAAAPTCATSSASCGRPSTSAPRRSSCGSRRRGRVTAS